MRASRRKDAVEVLQLLVHDPALVSRTMVEDVLRYKRLDGVTAALETIARAWFAGGRQTLDLTAAIAGLARAGAGDLGSRRPDHSGRARRGAGGASVPVHVLEAAGHLPHMEKSGEVNRLIRRFIGG